MKNMPLTTFNTTNQWVNNTPVECYKERLIMAIKNYCRSNNMAFSEKRLVIALKLLEIGEFISPEVLWLMLKKESNPISIGCVYANLKLMKSADLAVTATEGGRITLYKIKSSHH